MFNQKGHVEGIEIAEISLDDCGTFNCFSIGRFAFDKSDLKELLKLIENCKNHSNKSIIDLLENTGVEIVK